MSDRLESVLFTWQRRTAMWLAPMIVVHLATLFAVAWMDLDAGQMHARTRGSFWWGGFYTVFVLVAAVHASIGVHRILRAGQRPNALVRDVVPIALGLVLLGLGLRAVVALVI